MNPWDGVVCVLRDAIVFRTAAAEMIALSPAAGVTGEEMNLHFVTGPSADGINVRVTVLESRPVVVNGDLRHRLRLGLNPDGAEEENVQA